MTVFLLIVLPALAALNIYASLRCYRDELSSRGQRVAQIAFVWLVPLLGAALALHMQRSELPKADGTYPPEYGWTEETTTSGKLNENGYIGEPGENVHSSFGGDN